MNTIERLPPRAIAKIGDGAVMIATAVAPIAAAESVLTRCNAMSAPPSMDKRYLQATLAIAAHRPTCDEINDAIGMLEQALAQPLPSPMAGLLIAQLLDGSARKLPDNPESRLAALLAAVDDASDPVARTLDLWPTCDRPVSPAALCLAIKLLRATSKYSPEPAELRGACTRVYWKLRKVVRQLETCAEARRAIDEMILLHAPRHEAAEALAIPIEDVHQAKRWAQHRVAEQRWGHRRRTPKALLAKNEETP
jgi:hypothetical protein